MKKILSVYFILCINVLSSQNIEYINVPKRVVYNYCENAIINKVKEDVKKSVLDYHDDSIIADTLFIGPILWHEFKSNSIVNVQDLTTVRLIIDDIKIEGQMSEKKAISKIIWDEFRKMISQNEFTIRKANYNELEYYWTIISWDIDEPLLVLEVNNRNFILDFKKSSYKLFWIDEFSPNYNEEGAEKLVSIENGTIIFSKNLFEKETKLKAVTLLNTEEELKQNMSFSELDGVLKKTNEIFEQMVKDYDKSGNVIVEFELTKKENNINVIVTDELEPDFKLKFENLLKAENFPNSKKKPIKFVLVYLVNAVDKITE